MNFAPILAAPMVIQLHLLAALFALALGIGVLLMRKGTAQHVFAGRIWAATMIVVAISSFWIKSSGHFSWIHLLSILTLVSIPQAILARRKGDIRRHAIAMSMTFLGLLIAGIFTLTPGRILGAVVFGW